ncbi:hypothetical protein EZV62_007384 [Acer yangbiense]|uniref:Disease resistance R13L4/SHOC-2-like LRR domain-containing protein n=1 Tax=Acer yangbiense TaxID=1000413 RepID=A0A5C7IBI0_9ROSI|nr:hypothetical protein EZV62_007384 [Acer yangbiense]
MGSQNNLCMDVLKDEDALNLFNTTAGDCIEQCDLEVLAKDVSEACGGLPIAIYDGIYFHWKLAEIWGGFGMFENINTLEEAWNRVGTLVRKLVSSSLLIDTNNESFSMHDVVRIVANSIACRDQHMFMVTNGVVPMNWVDKDSLKTCTGISLQNIGELPKELVCLHLKFLYMKTKKDALKIPDEFFTGMPMLRVLHLVGFDLLSLPTSLGLLLNLRALCMDKCKVKDISLIGELKTLEILNFRGSKIMWLPVEICKLIGLRLLDLNGCSNLKDIPPNFISSLTRSEELYLGGTSIQWEVQGRSNTCLDELKGLSHLTTLEISILHTKVLSKGLFSKKLERYNITIGRCSWDHRLRLKQHETSRKLELNLGTSCSCFDFEDAPPKMPSVKNILSVLDGQGFPELEQLWVQDGPCLLTVVDSFESESRDPFPSLETLVLHKIFSIGREEDKIQLKELHSMTLARLPQLTVFCSASEVILEEEVDTLTPFFNEKVGPEFFSGLNLHNAV